jgi:PDZ domain-containing secreted protein
VIKGEKDKMVRAKDAEVKQPTRVFFFPDYGVSVEASSYEEALATVAKLVTEMPKPEDKN